MIDLLLNSISLIWIIGKEFDELRIFTLICSNLIKMQCNVGAISDLFTCRKKKTIIKNPFRTIIIHFQKNDFSYSRKVLVLGTLEVLFLIATITTPLEHVH